MSNSMPLDAYDDIPRSMRIYLRNFGWHFNRKLFEFAVGQLRVKGQSGKAEKIEPYTKEQVDELLNKYGVKLENPSGIDYVFIANVCKTLFLKKSVPDESHLAFYVRDIMDAPYMPEGMPLRMFCLFMEAGGEMFDWSDMI